MKRSLLILPLSFICLSACTKASVDYCKYAEIKRDYSFLGTGQGITGCEVVKSESKKMDLMGQKVIGHGAELKLKIEQVEYECESKQERECNISLKAASCIKENGKSVNACKYPDAKVVTAKGKFIKEIRRKIELVQEDGGQNRIDVVSNKGLK